MGRKQSKRKTGSMAYLAIAGFFILAIACGVGFGVASADSSDELARSGAFGFDAATHSATLSANAALPESSESAIESDDDVLEGSERSVFASPTSRDITSGLQMIDDKERAEQERIAAENAAAIERMKAEKAMQGVVSPESDEPDEDADKDAAEEDDGDSDDDSDDDADDEALVMEYNLPAVDWEVGQEEFLEEWTDRIDAYLAGSPLEGYGSVFAEAAWDNGVDPRWSPAISNTESTKGSRCFLPHNAWGWGQSSWSDWDTAIRAHVAGLASRYGYSITFDAAQTYCPPNCVNWYNDTLDQMGLI